MIKLIACSITILIGLLPAGAIAKLMVASPFTDNAVLQRHIPVPVWGTADAGTRVTVTLSPATGVKQSGQSKSVVADALGNWQVELDPMSASFTPQTLRVKGAKSELTFSNLLVGEVWITAGQSNMALQVAAVSEIKALLPKAKHIRSFEVPRTVALSAQKQLAGEWVEKAPSSAVAFAFAYFLQQAEDVPVGIILTAWGSSSIEAWMPRELTKTVPHFKTMMQEFDADEQTLQRIVSILEGSKPWSRNDDIFLRRQSNILYNAMVNPLIPYGSRGLLWYQGERNTQSMYGMVQEPWFSRNSGMLKYAPTLKALMQHYRKAWGQDDFHFITVMLPGYYKQLNTGPEGNAEDPNTHSWAWMRESQLKSLDLAHTSVVNTIDLGDVDNIHPRDKLPVGQRAALLALRDTLGHKIEAQGPVMSHIEQQGSKLIVHFEHAKELKTIDGNPASGFWLADDSAQWVKAEAVIKDQTVQLHSPTLSKPLYVRYAFAGKPKVNLVNGAGLPAYPFRSDGFEP